MSLRHAELLTLIKSWATLDDKEEELIVDSFKSLSLEKGDFFLKTGTIARHVGFLQSGLVRYFVYKDGEESTFEFTAEGEFIADYQSFRKQTPSIQNIQAIEDCELLIIGRDDLDKIFKTVKNGNLIGRLVVEHRFDIMVGQLLHIYMQSHEERYKNFLDKYADLSQRIPQYMIASYVGVKPQSLSRIRRRFSKQSS